MVFGVGQLASGPIESDTSGGGGKFLTLPQSIPVHLSKISISLFSKK